jgi:hypothetical protein
VPTSARAATIANRYFIRNLLLNFLPHLSGRCRTSRRDLAESGARRWNRRRLRAAVLGRNVSSKSFVTDRRINERRGEADEKGTAKGAESTAFLILVRFRRVPVAIVSRRFRFRFRAAARLLGLRDGSGSPGRNGGGRDRAGDEQAEQESQRSRSHHGPSLPSVARRDQPSHGQSAPRERALECRGRN